VFAALGFRSAFSLAVIAGVLQFLPIIGPSIVVIGLAAVEVSAGDLTGAVSVLVLGLVIVGFLPDAVIRTRMATATAGMPGTLYFVGFLGGVLSLGVVGVIAGPLVVALLIESVELVSTDLSTADPEAGPGDDPPDPDGESTGQSVPPSPTDEAPASDADVENPGGND